MDREAFSKKVWEMRGSMLRLSVSLMRSRPDAEDAVQDAVLRAWERLGSLRDEAAFKTWMLSIVVNACKSALRKRRRLVLAEDIEIRSETRNETASALWECVMALEEKYRVPIVLHYYEGFSVREIASIVHAPVGTVAARMRRAREKLKCELMQRGESA